MSRASLALLHPCESPRSFPAQKPLAMHTIQPATPVFVQSSPSLSIHFSFIPKDAQHIPRRQSNSHLYPQATRRRPSISLSVAIYQNRRAFHSSSRLAPLWFHPLTSPVFPLREFPSLTKATLIKTFSSLRPKPKFHLFVGFKECPKAIDNNPVADIFQCLLKCITVPRSCA